MYKIGTICIGQNFERRGSDRNSMECEVIAPLDMKTSRCVFTGHLFRRMAYGVRWADGRVSAVMPPYLRPKHLPPDTSAGLTAILNLFKEPAPAAKNLRIKAQIMKIDNKEPT